MRNGFGKTLSLGIQHVLAMYAGSHCRSSDCRKSNGTDRRAADLLSIN